MSTRRCGLHLRAGFLRTLACQIASFAIAVLVSTGVTLADWPNQSPTKWVQLPDRGRTGMDVLATTNASGLPGTVLADDFRCDFSGPITDIHIWGSWLNEQLPNFITRSGLVPDPRAVRFNLSIHSDIPDPDGPTGPDYSRPGERLWDRGFGAGDFVVRRDGTGDELFYNPNQDQIIGSDSTLWQYNFLIPEDEAFRQKQGNIYWLSLQAMVGGDGSASGFTRFGWKTRDPEDGHFNDDAVFGNAPFPGNPGSWSELRYPDGTIPPQLFHPGFPNGHPYSGRSIDLAFALTTVPEPSSLAVLVLGGGAFLPLRRRRQG